MEFLKSIGHPDEILALIRFRCGSCAALKPKVDSWKCRPTMVKCYKYLAETSRSFAAVIQALDGELRNAVCIFYLVLRTLDTLEDDMTISKDVKIEMLRQFHTHLHEQEWRYLKSEDKARIVLEDFPTISFEFKQLRQIYQDVIEDVCKKMGHGMTVFIEKNVKTMDEWDEYCHYVAGLVGIGLSQLFSASGLEDKEVGTDTRLSNSMGLFLQKTNIIRDYLEDQEQGREFWPQMTWQKYSRSLRDFTLKERRNDGLHCLNELITNALELIPDCMKYMSRIQNQSVFNFCAIPQLMAIATLERCYNNPKVFTEVVKIRKGEAVKMMMTGTDIEDMKAIICHFVKEIQNRIPESDPNSGQTRRLCEQALLVCKTKREYTTYSFYPPLYVSCAMMLGAIIYHYWSQVGTLYSDYINSQ